jgi:hypothetical protein
VSKACNVTLHYNYYLYRGARHYYSHAALRAIQVGLEPLASFLGLHASDRSRIMLLWTVLSATH